MNDGKRFVDLEDGSRISAMVKGDLRGEVIVFVNGSIFNYRQFLGQLYPRISSKLPENYSYVFYDYVGIGESSELKNGFDFKVIADQHKQFLDALGLERAHHFGYSKGAIISLITADRAESIATVGTPNLAYKDRSSEQDMEKRRQSLQGIMHLRDRRIDKETFPILYREVFQGVIFGRHKLSLKEKIKSWVVQRMSKPLLMGTPISSIIDLYTMYSEPHNYEKYYTDTVSAIKAPVLMMHGEADTTVPVEGARELQKLIPNAELRTYEGFTHTGPAFIKAQAEQLATDYTEFLGKL